MRFSLGLVLNIVSKLLALALGIYSFRWLNSELSAESLSLLNLTESYLSPVLMFIGFGLPIIIQKFYTNTKSNAQDGLPDFWASMMWFRFISFFVGLVIILGLKLFSSDFNLILGFFVYLYSFLVVVDYSFFAVFAARAETWRFSVTDFVSKLSIVVLLYLFTIYETAINPLTFFVWVTMLGSALSLMVDWKLLKKATPFGKFKKSILRKELRPMLLLAMSYFIIGIYQNWHIVFLSKLGYGDDIINGFKNGYRVVEQTITVAGVVTPQFASFIKNRLEGLEFGNIMRKVVLYVSVFSLLVGFGYLMLYYFGPYVIKLIDSNNNYPIAFEILPILGIYSFCTIVATLITYITIFYGKEKYHLISVSVQAVLSLLLYFLLIPRFGYIGAAWSIVIVSLVDLVLMRVPMLIIAIKIYTSKNLQKEA